MKRYLVLSLLMVMTSYGTERIRRHRARSTGTRHTQMAVHEQILESLSVLETTAGKQYAALEQRIKGVADGAIGRLDVHAQWITKHTDEIHAHAKWLEQQRECDGSILTTVMELRTMIKGVERRFSEAFNTHVTEMGRRYSKTEERLELLEGWFSRAQQPSGSGSCDCAIRVSAVEKALAEYAEKVHARGKALDEWLSERITTLQGTIVGLQKRVSDTETRVGDLAVGITALKRMHYNPPMANVEKVRALSESDDASVVSTLITSENASSSGSESEGEEESSFVVVDEELASGEGGE